MSVDDNARNNSDKNRLIVLDFPWSRRIIACVCDKSYRIINITVRKAVKIILIM